MYVMTMYVCDYVGHKETKEKEKKGCVGKMKMKKKWMKLRRLKSEDVHDLIMNTTQSQRKRSEVCCNA